VNSPSNPTGGVWSQDAMGQIVELARFYDLWLLSDEAYEKLSYDRPYRSPATYATDYGKVLTFQSCSKSYAMTGWRIGYMAGDARVVEAMSKIQGQSTSCPNSIAQMAAIAALTGDQSVVEDMKAAFQRRRELIVGGLSQVPGFRCRKPGGAFYVFPEVSNLFGKSGRNGVLASAEDMTEYLLAEANVVTVSGEGFGDPRHIRLSYAASDEDINAAVDRIAEAIDKLN
jgi:aspartate aminotransferase